MGRLAADDLGDPLPVGAVLYDLPTDVEADALEDAEDVTLRCRCVGADDEVGSTEEVEVEGVVVDVVADVHELTELLRRLGGLDAEAGVERLRGSEVVGDGADTADAGRDYGHVLRPAPLAELLEAAELRDLQVRVLHVARVVEEDADLAVALEPRDGVDGYGLHFFTLLPMMEAGSAYL